jgi:ligand-binding SRPBCC domain-containing protein
MGDYIRESRLWLPLPRETVFALFSDARNLARITPPWLGFTIVGPVPAMAAGAVIDYRIRWLGIPLPWRTYIREWDPPVRFLDVQVRGPYSRWEHRHIFLEERAGTWIEDRLTYRLPFGPLGRLAHALVVERQIEAIWRYRDRKVAELLGVNPPEAR